MQGVLGKVYLVALGEAILVLCIISRFLARSFDPFPLLLSQEVNGSGRVVPNRRAAIDRER